MEQIAETGQIREYKYRIAKQTPLERKRRSFVQHRFTQMDTDYRQALLEMAALGRDATDGIATDTDRVGYSELLKVPISHAVIMQRMSTMIDNPSRAIYKAESKNLRQLNILRQLNHFDKLKSRYDASYQNFQAKAEKEGIAIIRQSWHEDFRDMPAKNGDGTVRVTVGDYFTSNKEVPLENCWWDESASELRGQEGYVANDFIQRSLLSIDTMRRLYENDPRYKNIEKVKPFMDDSFFTSCPWTPEWDGKTVKSDSPMNEAVMWEYFARNFWDEEEGRWTDIHLKYINGIEVYKERLPVPLIKGLPELPFWKLVAIPTGGFGGISIPAIIRHPERALQRMITMADAQAEMAINPAQFVSEALAEVLADEELTPGFRIGVPMQARTLADEVYTLETRDITPGAQYIIDKMMEIISIVTGVDIRAFFESPKQKAVSTERKREIQERLLRFSVIYNEAHGFTDMEIMRLHLMLENYPKKRLLYKKEEERETYEEGFPRIPVDGYQVTVVDGTQEKREEEREYDLKKRNREFSFLTITPASMIDSYNVEIFISGASQASSEDVFELNKAMDLVAVLSSNPWTAQAIDPVKGAKQVFKAVKADEDEWVREELEDSDSTKHGAEKEIQALMAADAMEIQIPLDDDYDAPEYADIFFNFVSTPEFRKLSPAVQQKIFERSMFHNQNAVNPYYKEQMAEQKMADQAAAAGAMPGAQEALENAAVESKQPNELEQRVDSKAGTLGKAGKPRGMNSMEQRRAA